MFNQLSNMTEDVRGVETFLTLALVGAGESVWHLIH